MKWFIGISDLKSLRKKYVKLAKENHPDHGGNEENMKEINLEYATLSKLLKSDVHFRETYTFHQENENQPTRPEEFLIIAKKKNYKIGWVAMQSLKYAKSYEDCLRIARVCNYKDGWAWYKWKEIQATRYAR